MSQIQQVIRKHRRINGFQLPLSIHQIISWLVLIITAVSNFSMFIFVELPSMKTISVSILAILYIGHLAMHVAASVIDPAEKEVRNRKTTEVPEFDRTLHAHVIEDGRCHLCNIYTSTKNTKHCGICNKCVYKFDHHCKWLNNCIGGRNYFAFIGCIVTTLFISMFTLAMYVSNICIFLTRPQLLSVEAQEFINCTSTDMVGSVKYCQSSIIFLVVLIILTVSGLAMTLAMAHLCSFHMYICTLRVSTYEYIVNIKNKNDKKPTKTKDQKAPENEANESKDVTESNENNTGTTNLENIIIDDEKNKTLFCSDKNKVHPDNLSNVVKPVT